MSTELFTIFILATIAVFSFIIIVPILNMITEKTPQDLKIERLEAISKRYDEISEQYGELSKKCDEISEQFKMIEVLKSDIELIRNTEDIATRNELIKQFKDRVASGYYKKF